MARPVTEEQQVLRHRGGPANGHDDFGKRNVHLTSARQHVGALPRDVDERLDGPAGVGDAADLQALRREVTGQPCSSNEMGTPPAVGVVEVRRVAVAARSVAREIVLLPANWIADIVQPQPIAYGCRVACDLR